MFYVIASTAFIIAAVIIRLSLKRSELHERLLENFNKPFDN